MLLCSVGTERHSIRFPGRWRLRRAWSYVPAAQERRGQHYSTWCHGRVWRDTRLLDNIAQQCQHPPATGTTAQLSLPASRLSQDGWHFAEPYSMSQCRAAIWFLSPHFKFMNFLTSCSLQLPKGIFPLLRDVTFIFCFSHKERRSRKSPSQSKESCRGWGMQWPAAENCHFFFFFQKFKGVFFVHVIHPPLPPLALNQP